MLANAESQNSANQWVRKLAVAGRLLGTEIRRLKLKGVDLRRADLQLGEKAYTTSTADGQAELVVRLNKLTQRVTELRQQPVATASTFGEKAKAFGRKIAKAVQLEGLQRKRRRVLRQLGAKLRQTHTNSALSEEAQSARGVTDGLSSVETEISQLAPQTYFWARRPLLLICLLLLLGAIGGAFAVRQKATPVLAHQGAAAGRSVSDEQMNKVVTQQQRFAEQTQQMQSEMRRREIEQTQARIAAKSDEQRREVLRRAQNEVEQSVAAAEHAYKEQQDGEQQLRRQEELEEQRHAAVERARVEERERQRAQLAIAEKQRQEQAQREAEAKRLKQQQAALEQQKEQDFAEKLRKAAEKLAVGKHAEAFELYQEAISSNPDNPKGYVARGRAWFETNQKDAALKDFDDALKHNPTEAEAYLGLGIVHASNSDHEKAIAEYTKAVECRSDYVEAYYERGVSRLALKQPDKARQDFDRVIRLDPKSARGYLNRGRALVELHETDKALPDYNHAVELGGRTRDVLLARADAYLQLGQYESAQHDLEAAVSLDPEYVPAYAKLVEVFSATKNEPLAVLNRGRGYFYSHDYAKATDEFERAVKLQPTLAVAHLELGRSKSAEAIFAIAEATAGTRAGVITDIRVGEKIDKAVMDIRDRIARAAVASLKKATELNPNDSGTWMELGKGYFFWDPVSATGAFEHVLALDPKSADAHFWLGLTKYTWGEKAPQTERTWQQFKAKLAVNHLNAAIKLNPQHAGAYYLRGSVHRRFEEYAKAIDDLTAAIARASPGQHYLEYAGTLYSYYREVSDIPDELIAVSLKAAAYAQRAQCHFDNGDKEELVATDLDEAIRLVPKERKLSALRNILR